jgi:hypothetical protein
MRPLLETTLRPHPPPRQRRRARETVTETVTEPVTVTVTETEPVTESETEPVLRHRMILSRVGPLPAGIFAPPVRSK